LTILLPGLRPSSLHSCRRQLSELNKNIKHGNVGENGSMEALFEMKNRLEERVRDLNHQHTSIVYKMLHDELHIDEETLQSVRRACECVDKGIDEINRVLKHTVPARAYREKGAGFLAVRPYRLKLLTLSLLYMLVVLVV
jgi:hypothetical protein